MLAELAAAAAARVKRAVVHAILRGIAACATMVAGAAHETGGDHDLQP